MPRRYSADEIVAAIQRIGFRYVRQVGSHMRYRAVWRGRERNVSIVAGTRQVKPKTLGSILDQAGIDAREFAELVAGRSIKE